MPDRPEENRRARVGICIATYKRPQLLRQLLEGISALTFQKMPVPEIRVIVVDNDPERSAKETVRGAQSPWQTTYAVEPRRGIAQARNRTIREAGDAEFVAFIDDDEIPAASWLDELLSAQAASGADVVSGRVIPCFGAGIPEWVKTGAFFEKPAPAASKGATHFTTANLLVRSAVFACVPAFDERFALTGGEDTQFFLRVRAAGFAVTASGTAIVHEFIPPSRGNLSWLLRRAFQAGNSWVLCEASVDGRLSTRAMRICKACARMLEGAVAACLSLFFGRVAFARALGTLCLGAGMLAALVGQKYQPYLSAGLDPARGSAP